MSVDDFVFLESFQGTKRASGDVASLVITDATATLFWVFFKVGFGNGREAFNKVYSVGVDDSVVAASNSKVVGDQDDRSFSWGCYPGLFRASERWSSTSSSISSTAVVITAPSSLVVSVVSGLHCNLNKNMSE